MKHILRKQALEVSLASSIAARGLTVILDVLIVDSRNDLNVYMTAADGEASCCGAVTESKCCITDQKETCYQPGSSTCDCQDKTSIAKESQQLAAALGIVDFNEWAGMNIAALDMIGYANT